MCIFCWIFEIRRRIANFVVVKLAFEVRIFTSHWKTATVSWLCVSIKPPSHLLIFSSFFQYFFGLFYLLPTFSQLRLETIKTGTPNGRTVHWFWEPTGFVGKSAFCKYMVVKHNATVVRGGKLSDIMNIIFNTDMDKCNCILFDIPRGTGGNVSYTSLESILD